MIRTTKLLCLAITFCLISVFAFAANTGVVITQQQQQDMTPQQALQLLKMGNERFLANEGKTHNYTELAAKTAAGQHPIAIILSCIDSRGTPEVLFNQATGNIFVARVAGNIVDKKILGSMEFATKVMGAKLIVVMGHTACGAIKGACTNVQLHHISYIVNAIQPAVKQVKQSETNNFNCDSPVTIDAVAKQNVLDQMQRIQTESPAIAKLVSDKKIMIVGAMQDIATGKVTFFDATGQSV